MAIQSERPKPRVNREAPVFEWDQRRWQEILTKAQVCDRVHIHGDQEYDAEHDLEFSWEEDIRWLGSVIHTLRQQIAIIKEDVADAMFALGGYDSGEKLPERKR
jgi:hypothetical protein